MAIDREDVEAVRERTRKSRETRDRIDFLRSAQEKAKPYESLVNDPSWNPYVNELTEWMMAARERANVLAGQMNDPGKFLTADQVVYLRMNVAALRAEADAHSKSIALVRGILEKRDHVEDVMHREVASQHA